MKNNQKGSSHPENFCHQCGSKNPHWYAENQLWNLLCLPHEIICPSCFQERAENKGINMTFVATEPKPHGFLTFNLTAFSEAVKHKRVEVKRYSMKEVARETGISISTISRLEKGRFCDIETFVRLLNWLEHEPREYIYPYKSEFNL